MTGATQQFDPQLIGTLAFLMRQIADEKARSEALRMVLVDRGVITDEEFQAAYRRAEEALQKLIANLIEQAGQLQLLNAFDPGGHFH